MEYKGSDAHRRLLNWEILLESHFKRYFLVLLMNILIKLNVNRISL